MRTLKGAIFAGTVIMLSCLRHDNPFDITAPNYDPPIINIDSSSVNIGDSAALETITVTVSGNKPEVEIRWRLDSLPWTIWREQGTVTVGGYGIGRHTITIAGWYGEGGQIVDTAFSFVKVTAPALTADTTSFLSDSLASINPGALCTLRVNAGGSGTLTYYWHHGDMIIDSTNGNTLTIGPFSAKDSGYYFVVVGNKWGTATSDTVFLRYTPLLNNAPVAVRDSFTMAEDGALTVAAAQSILKNDTDKDGDTLSAIMVDSTRNGTLTLAANGTFTYRPGTDFFGTDSFTYKSRDTKNTLSTMVAVRIIVTPVNDPPVLTKNDRVTLNEGQTVTIGATKVQVTDIDNTASAIMYSLRRKPANGSLLAADTSLDSGKTFSQKAIDDGLLTYRHDGGETTKDTAVFSFSDSSGEGLDTIRIMFDITPINDAPYFATKLDLAMVEGGSKMVSFATLQVKDNDNMPMQIVYTIVNAVSNGQVRKNGSTLDAGATFTQQDIDSGRIVYQHDGSNSTRDSLSFIVSDGKGGTIAQTWLIIRIGSVDDPPAAIDQSVSTNEDTSLAITLSATDPENVAITGWEISRQPRHGTLTGSGATRTYTPEKDFFGADTFMFRGNDGVNWSDSGIIAFTVLPVNDAPEWKLATVELPVKEGTTATLDLNTVFEKDPEGDNVVFSKKSGVGTLTGRTWSWTPGFTTAATSPAGCVITATDKGSPVKSSDITLVITVSDSLCKLTATVAIGTGTVQLQPTGTHFDPGTEVQVTANPGTNYVFKNWTGDVEETKQGTAKVSIIMNGDKTVAATFVKTIETVTLNIGESFVHGSLYVNGYYFLSTRTSPAKLLRLNANNLSDYQEITFSSGHDYADQITYVESKHKLYVVFGAHYRTAIAEVDPITMAYNEDAIIDTLHGASPLYESQGGQSICNDGEFLYVVTSRADTSRILKFSLSTMAAMPIAILNFPIGNLFAHAIRYENGKLYVSNGYGTPWVARVNAQTLQIEEIQSFLGKAFTDDFAISGNYLFLGIEADYSHEQSGKILRLDKTDFDSYYYFGTGTKGSASTEKGYNYSVQEFDGTIWAIFATNPGTITRINPISLEYQNYSLPNSSPNELVFDGRRILITYWDQDPGVVQAIDPVYLNGREIP